MGVFMENGTIPASDMTGCGMDLGPIISAFMPIMVPLRGSSFRRALLLFDGRLFERGHG